VRKVSEILSLPAQFFVVGNAVVINPWRIEYIHIRNLYSICISYGS